jgi:hypothetical protein
MLGTDFPLGPPMAIGMKELGELGLAADVLAQIERGNARQLFAALR